MTFWDRCGARDGSVYDYDDYCDDSPDYCYHDGSGDLDGYPDLYGLMGLDEYELCHDLHGPDDCGVYCVYRRDVDVMPYGTGAGLFSSGMCLGSVSGFRTEIK